MIEHYYCDIACALEWVLRIAALTVSAAIIWWWGRGD